MDGKDWSLLAVAKRQQGVITDAQALAVGFNKSAIKWRLRVGEWTRVLPRVARMYWADDTWTTRCWAASLWAASPATALSHTTAARLLGFDLDAGSSVHVTTEGEMRSRSSRWCRHHRAKMLRGTVDVAGLCLTTPARTLLDLAAVLDSPELEQVLSLAMRHGQVTTSALRDELKHCRGKKGAARLRGLFNRLVRA